MGRETGIEWCHHTFNPWRGCTKISPGCANCYAEKMSHRNPKVLGEWGPEGTRIIAVDSYWRQPLKWARDAAAAGERRRVFCASLADVFEDRPELVAPRVRLFHLISDTRRHLDWLLLTKRPENIRRFHGGNGVTRSWPENMPPNVWLGVSVEDQARADERIPHILKTPAAVRFLSCEPLLSAVDLRHVQHDGIVEIDALTGDHGVNRPLAGRSDAKIDWVIAGGESGPHARPCDLAWIRSLIGQCKAANVACFLKQLGSQPIQRDPINPLRAQSIAEPGCAPPVGKVDLRDSKGGEPDEWPTDLRIREFPEVAHA